MSRNAKFIVFILLSFALHLLLLLVKHTNQPTMQKAEAVGIGLVQRSFSHVNPVDQRPAQADSAPVRPNQAVIQKRKSSPALVKLQELTTESTALRLEQKIKTAVLPPEPPVVQVPPIHQIAEKVTSAIVAHPNILPGSQVATANSQPQDINAGQGEPKAGITRSILTAASVSNPTLSAKQDFQDALPRYDLNPRPGYPEVSRRRGQHGTVLLEVAIQADGSVEKVSITQSTGYRLLDRAALAAVRHWRFRPATSAGLAVASRVVIPVDFVLHAD